MGGESHNISGKTAQTDDRKSELGQFYTTNYDHILKGMSAPKGSNIIEPFVGNGDLVRWCESLGHQVGEGYDLSPPDDSHYKDVIVQDTLMNPPNYDGKFIVTNPPYLASNKAEKVEGETAFEKWQTSDLYKAFIKSFCSQAPSGGVIIVPLNFICDAKDKTSRSEFLSKFSIDRMNVFEEQVFEDTSYTVCSIQFSLRKTPTDESSFDYFLYPGEEKVKMSLHRKYGWQIAGDYFNESVDCEHKISRLLNSNGETPLTKEAREKSLNPHRGNRITNLMLHCVDGKHGNKESSVRMEWNPVPLFGKDTDRSFCTIVIDPPISQDKQRELMNDFNEELSRLREKYHSLFLVNFREFGRKRISFTIAFDILRKCLKK
jgi:hypothetical protein